MPGSYQVTPAILGRRRATQRITVTPASKPGRPTASYRVSPPPARGPTSRVGRHRPSARDPDTEAGYPGRPPGGGRHPVPISRCLSAAGIRFSVILDPPRNWALLTVGLPAAPRGAPDLDGVSAFRTHELRPGWAPSVPRGRRCSSRTGFAAQPAPAASRRPVLQPRSSIHRAGLRLTRHQRGFTRFTRFARPVFPSPAAARMERAAAWAFPELRTPPTKSRTTHVEAGTGHRARTWNYTLNITSVDPPTSSSLNTCDLASHTKMRQSAGAEMSCADSRSDRKGAVFPSERRAAPIA